MIKVLCTYVTYQISDIYLEQVEIMVDKMTEEIFMKEKKLKLELEGQL